MFGRMTDWLTIAFTTLGAGAAGSIITTFGTQTRERRQARGEAREAIRQVQNLILQAPTYDQLAPALGNPETSAMLAGLPKSWSRSITMPSSPSGMAWSR